MRVPKSWKDVSIGQFINYRAALEMRDIDNIDRSVQVLSALTSTPIEQIEQLSIRQINNLILQINFTHTLPSEKPRKYFFLHGMLYKVCINPADMTPAMLVDLQGLTKDQDSIIDNIDKIMAVICQSVFIKKYDGANLYKRAAIFNKYMDVDFFYPIALFFCKLLTSLLETTNTYLIQEAERNLMKAQTLMKSNTQTIGTGT